MVVQSFELEPCRGVTFYRISLEVIAFAVGVGNVVILQNALQPAEFCEIAA